MKKIVTFGEMMLRLKSPGNELLFQSPLLEATFGGGEANVAVGLSYLGLDAAFATIIPDNPVGDACVRELKRHGVDTSFIVRKGNRLGVYFFETGANQRPSKVVYDRFNSAVSECKPGDIPFDSIFKDASWFHITGITPAISATAADSALEAVKIAKRNSITISCDLNYREKLWNYGKKAPEVMRELVKYTDIVIGNEEDCQKSLGMETETDVDSGKLSAVMYEKLAKSVVERFPNIKKIAITMRESHSADHNGWSALLSDGKEVLISEKYEIKDIVDRVGGGDSFSSGLIYGLNTLHDDLEVLNFAVAMSCLKHSIPGDLPLITKKDVEMVLKTGGSGRVQR